MVSIFPEFAQRLPFLGQFTTQKPTFFLSKMLGTHKRRDFSHFRQIKFKYDICEFWLGGRALYRSGPRQRWQPNYLYTDRFKNLYSSWNRVTGIIFAWDREYLNNNISQEPNIMRNHRNLRQVIWPWSFSRIPHIICSVLLFRILYSFYSGTLNKLAFWWEMIKSPTVGLPLLLVSSVIRIKLNKPILTW